MSKPAFQPSLKGRALRLLSQREHSRTELERKLAPHAQEPGELAKTLDELQARDFINEGRVLESVVHRRGAEIAALCAQLLTTPAAQLEREFRSKQFPLPDALMPR